MPDDLQTVQTTVNNRWSKDSPHAIVSMALVAELQRLTAGMNALTERVEELEAQNTTHTAVDA